MNRQFWLEVRGKHREDHPWKKGRQLGSTTRNKRRVKENLHPLLDAVGIAVTKGGENIGVLSTFHPSVLRERCIVLKVLTLLSWKTRMGTRRQYRYSKRKWSMTS